MKHIIIIIVFFIFGFEGWSQTGQVLFEKNCFTCHNKIGSNKGFTGPSLGGITNLVTEDWFIDFVSSPMLMHRKRDYRLWCALERFKPTWMPDFKDSLTEVQVRSIYDYIAEETANKDLKYEFICDSNFAFSNFYLFDSLPQVLAHRLGLSFEWKNDTVIDFQNLSVKVVGDFNSISFYEAHSSRGELDKISPRKYTKGFKGPFRFTYLDIYPGNFLIVVAQGDFNKFDIQKFSLAARLPKKLKIILGEKGDMLTEIDELGL